MWKPNVVAPQFTWALIYQKQVVLQNDQCKVGKKRKLEQHSLKFFMAVCFFFLVTKVYLGRMRNNF